MRFCQDGVAFRLVQFAFKPGYRARQGPQQCGETWKELLKNAARWETAPERHYRGMAGQGTSERDSWQQLISLLLCAG